MNTDQKLDKLIKSVSELKKLHDSSHKDLEGKLQKSEVDMAVSQELQEDATEIEFKPLNRGETVPQTAQWFDHKTHNRGHQLEERMCNTMSGKV